VDRRFPEGLVLDATLRDNLVPGELGSFAGKAWLLDLGAASSLRPARTRMVRLRC
jgi:hypothetical protein